MRHFLVDLMSQLTSLSDEEKVSIEQSFPIKTFDKGTYLIREGQIAKNSYLVIEGCVREFELIDGEEKTTAFYTENQSVVNFHSLTNQAPSKVNFICLEKATIAIINSDKEKELYTKHPRFESFCRSGMEQMMGDKQEQLVEVITMKPEKRYEKLQEERPDLLNRVPLYQIASYLGVTPEALSRIRKRLSQK